MPTLAIILLLTSALMHAVWNLILKQSDIKYVAMNWQVLLSGAAAILAVFFVGLIVVSIDLYRSRTRSSYAKRTQ